MNEIGVHHLLVAALLLVVTSMILVLIRALRGPTAHDRILAGNAFGSNTVLAIILLAYVVDNPMFLDIALVYATINFIGTIALLKLFRFGRFDAVWTEQPSVERDHKAASSHPHSHPQQG